ncbi:MAG: PH domain-containing protein [Gammaproteobacteria bacterium]|nr:PH domain-containing protein [Gammaproteobacteria bacterium]
MHYTARPAWRNSLLRIATALFLIVFGIVLFYTALADADPPVRFAVAGLGVLIALFLLAPGIYEHFAWRYVIADRSIECHHGILSRDVNAIRLRDLRNVNVRQSLLQRLLGVGDVEFSSAGGSGIEVAFRGVVDPLGLKRKVQVVQEEQDALRPRADG